MQKILTSLLALLAVGVLQAQEPELPEIVPPSPTVANLMKFEEVPVSYYTGQPNISIPLYSKKLGASASLGLGLSYSTSSLQSEQRSSWVGTGWSLTGVGAVSRVVKGLPDEEDSVINRKGIYHNSDYWNYNSLSASQKAEFHWKVRGDMSYKYDTELDLYQYNFMGYSGRFVIEKVGGLLEVRKLGEVNNLKITISYNFNTYDISSFTFQDTNGNKYTFGDRETTTYSTISSGTQQNGTPFYMDINSGAYSQITYTSAWKMSNVKTSNDKLLATLSYHSIAENYLSRVSTTTNEITSHSPNADLLKNAYNNGILKPRKSSSYTQTSNQAKYLASINFNDGTRLEFSVQTSHPETGGAILDKIEHFDVNNALINYYDLTQQTTTSNQRLWLENIQFKPSSSGSSQDHHFTYNSEEELPEHDIITNSGSGQNYSACGSNSYDFTTGALTRIDYPTGGFVLFEWERNTIGYEGSTPIPAEPNTLPQNGGSTFQASINNPSQNSQLIILDHSQAINFNIYQSAGDPSLADEFRFVLIDSAGNKTTVPKDGCSTVGVSAGNYTLTTELITSQISGNNNSVSFVADWWYASLGSGTTAKIPWQGLRIKTIDHKKNTLISAKKQEFSYDLVSNSSRSSGAIDAPREAYYRDHNITEKRYLFSTLDNLPGAYGVNTVTYHISNNNYNQSLGSTKGGYVGYKNVTVKQVAFNGVADNGYQVFTYTSPIDYPAPSGQYQYPFLPQPETDFKRGLMKSHSVYDQANRILKEEVVNHDFETVNQSSSLMIYEDPTAGCEWRQYYEHYSGYLSKSPEKNIPTYNGFPFPITYNNCGLADPTIAFITYNLSDGWAKVTNRTTKDYFYNSSGTQSVVEKRYSYLYNDQNYQVREEKLEVDEGGDNLVYTTNYYYPVGSTLGSNSTSMRDSIRDLNKVTSVLETTVKRNGTLLSQNNTVYKNYHPNVVMPHMIYTKKASLAAEERIEFHNYDDYGNLLEVSKKDGAHTYYIWGYQKTFPVAKIENATHAQVNSLVANIQSKSNQDSSSCLDSSSCSEKTLRNALNGLRSSLPSALISTYTYDPALGLTSMTDPRGYTTYYRYDDYGRLYEVKDADGNILSQNQYNYAGQ